VEKGASRTGDPDAAGPPTGQTLSVVVPCFNEQKNLPILVNRINQAMGSAGIPGEIILVNDGSTDATGALGDQIARQFQNVRVVHHAVNLGIVEGWRSGLAASKGDFVLTTDADLQYAPEDIPALYREMVAGGCDLAQGWRRDREEPNWLRDALSLGLSRILQWVFSMDLQDVKSGFICYRRDVFRDILDYRMKYFSFQSLITVAAHFKGYRIRQVPITFFKRHAGESFIQRPLIFSLKAAGDIPKAFYEYRIRKRR
jgi:glycosyltransferase involved in cell wall biosynthesis